MNTSKIIKAYIGAGTYSTTESITQGDYGYMLQIEGAELPATYRVDFSNNRHKGEAIPVYGNENGAEVPEELIATGKDIFAFYYYIGENFGKTAYTWKIPNDTRAQNGDRTPTPTQQDSIDQLIVRSNEAVTSAEQSASAAGQSAQNASDSAIEANRAELSAKSHALNAEQSSINADSSANDASTSAEASAQSANLSAQIKADVESLAEDAQAAANSSEISARASGEFASQVQGFANSASASANSASGYASQADISANTASNKASEASTSAQTASQKATESAQSASQALTYKTDAESAKTASQTAQGLAESARDSAITAKTDAESAKADAESARDEAQNLVDGISGKVEQIDSNTGRIESLEDDRYKPYVTDTASGSIASFSDGADDIPLKSLVVDINPIQDLSHGDPSPENICPISGWTSVGVEQSGVNVWDEEWEVGTYSTTTGDKATASNMIRSTNLIPVVPGVTYRISGTFSLGSYNGNLLYYDKDKTFVSSNYWGGSAHSTKTIPDGVYYIAFSVRNEYGTSYNNNIYVNYPSTDHDYHPYTGRSITIDLGQTVYDAKVNVINGEMIINRIITSITDSETWHSWGVNNLVQGVTGFYFYRNISPVIDFSNITDAKLTNALRINYNVWGGRNIGFYSNRQSENPQSWYEMASFGNNVLGIADTDTSKQAIDKLKAFLAVTPLQVVYELATPLTIQLTPNQVNSLLGVNNIFADSGDTEVEYRADTKLYIEKKIAEAISALS